MKRTNAKVNGHHRIKRLSVIGGFLDGLSLSFSDGLNCIIGPRGTGKTTIVELIRYAMDAMPGREGDPLRKRIESLVASNLNGGRIEVLIETKEGFSYTVTRSLGNPPIVLDAGGNPVPGIKVREGALFQADIFSQNQMESIAEMPHYQLDLIDKFRDGDLNAIYWKIEEERNAVESNTAKLVPLLSRCKTLQSEIEELPVIEAKLNELKETGGARAEAINRGHAQKALRDREERALNDAAQFIENLMSQLKGISGQLGSHIGTLFPQDMRKGLNSAAFVKIVSQLQGTARISDQHINVALEALRTAQTMLKKQRSLLEQAHKKQELAFLKLLEKYKEAQSKAAEREKEEKRRNELLAKKREISEIQQRIKALWTERKSISKVLSHLYDERFQMRSGIAKRLSEELSPPIRLRIRQCGNRTAYREYLERMFKGSQIKGNVVAAKIAESSTPDELVNLIKEGDVGRIAEECNLNDNQAEAVVSLLNKQDQFFGLELTVLEDAPAIELSDRGEYRETSALSTGQKCTAILPILLFESANPLLIDQPEDNLDNSYIFETVVETVRKVKESRQLIFVTHNPNIPVLGDASLVLVMGTDGAGAKITRQGDVDECKQDIVTLLEGGEEAFKARKERYHY